MSTFAETDGEASAPPAEVVYTPEDEPVVYEKIQFNGKPTFTDKAYAIWTVSLTS